MKKLRSILIPILALACVLAFSPNAGSTATKPAPLAATPHTPKRTPILCLQVCYGYPKLAGFEPGPQFPYLF